MYFQKASHVNIIIHFLKKKCSLNSSSSIIICAKKYEKPQLYCWKWLCNKQIRQRTAQEINSQSDLMPLQNERIQSSPLQITFFLFLFMRNISQNIMAYLLLDGDWDDRRSCGCRVCVKCQEWCWKCSVLKKHFALVSIWKTKRLRFWQFITSSRQHS